MSKNSRSIALDAEGHLPPELLRQYQAEALPPALRHQVERHLLDCSLCSDLAEGMALSDPAQTQAAVQDLGQRVSGFIRRQQPLKKEPTGWGNWRAAAAILVLLVSAVLVLYDQLGKVRSAEVAASPASEEAGPAPAPPVLRPAEPMAGAALPPPPPASPAALADGPAPLAPTLPATPAAPAPPPVARADQDETAAKDMLAASSPAPGKGAVSQQSHPAPPDLPPDQQPGMQEQVRLEEAAQGRVAAVGAKLAEDSKGLSEVVVVGSGARNRAAGQGARVAAQPVPGLEAYRQYLQQNLRYPEEVRRDKLRGRVEIGFTVSPTGQLEDVQVRKGLCPACDAEAIRLIQEGPAWKPSTQGGQPVADQVRVTVPFRP